jgi:hypothetical protein
MEDYMKRIVTALTLAGVVFALPASAKNVCIDTRDIIGSNSKDGKTMVFRMRDGTTIVNHLQGSCPDLRFNGYAWTLRSGDTQVCERQQSLRVLESGQICVLGKFDPPVSKAASK